MCNKAARHGALFTIKNGVLVWLERGVGQTADGTQVATEVVGPTSLVVGSFWMSETDVDHFATVKTYWQDRAGSTRQEIVVDADPEAEGEGEGEGEHVLRDPYGSRAEVAAAAAVREMLRGLVTFSCSMVSGAGLMAGLPISFSGVRPLVDGRVSILEAVKHTYTKLGGLLAVLNGKLKAD
ncbi:hypothetical protein OAN307_c39240 [Octadecabacter antarcticus 307]|uniref:Uncharacterized protein n=1 Tax=Octadecabacter antarcticus 307 TaxID=391626 RepID=M9R9K9_9RHOB|nr:hypothetical protein [Octadecabacter antarcticus]AGI69354.1 hypothetical protein OAN307_c39240 [Octadecabacter antarcticus 307]